MAIDITKGSHMGFFPANVASAEVGSPHVYNITLAQDHDNGQLVVRKTDEWVSFDNYEEDTTGTVTFSGVVLGASTSHPGYWYVGVKSVSANTVVVYNTPKSPYNERDLRGEKLFYNEAGDVVQGLSLIAGDVLELSANAFSGTIAAKAAVTYTNGKYKI